MTGAAVRATAIPDAGRTVAVDACLAAPDRGPVPIAGGHGIEIAAAIEASALARSAMADPGEDEVLPRRAVRSGNPLARRVRVR